MMHQAQTVQGQFGTCRVPFSSYSRLAPLRSSSNTQKRYMASAAASRPSCQRSSGEVDNNSIHKALSMPLAASAAAAAVLLWPVQAVHALPESQMQEIKQTIDRDFQHGQVRLLPKAHRQTTASCRNHTSAVQESYFSTRSGFMCH